jgi:hypothetical protein
VPNWKLIISGRNKRETSRRPSQGVKKKLGKFQKRKIYKSEEKMWSWKKKNLIEENSM